MQWTNLCHHLAWGVWVVARVAKKVREERQTEISVKGPCKVYMGYSHFWEFSPWNIPILSPDRTIPEDHHHEDVLSSTTHRQIYTIILHIKTALPWVHHCIRREGQRNWIVMLCVAWYLIIFYREKWSERITKTRPAASACSRPILRAIWRMAAYFQRHTKRNRIVKDLWSRRNCLRSIGSRQQRDEKNVSVGGEGGVVEVWKVGGRYM